MQTPEDEIQLKALYKSALVEALEDIALARAIQEGEASVTVSREEIFQLFEKAP